MKIKHKSTSTSGRNIDMLSSLKYKTIPNCSVFHRRMAPAPCQLTLLSGTQIADVLKC